MLSKTCSSCKKFKLTNAFSSNKSRKDKLHNECKQCQVTYNRLYILQTKYQLTKEDARALVKKIEHGCEICRTPLSLGRSGYAVDHDHQSNKIRGVLCQDCNLGLGFFQDNPGIINKAITYLKHHGN